MKKLIKITAIICIIALFAGCGLVSKEEEPKKVENVITIGKTKVSAERFNFYLYNAQGEALVAEGYQQSADVPKDFWKQKVDGKTRLSIVKENALSSLIDETVAYQRAKKLGLKLSEEDKSNIDAQIASIQQNSQTLELLNSINVSIEEFKKYLEEGALTQKLIPELIKKGDIKVDEAEVLKNFRENYVKAKHILIVTTDPTTGAALPEEDVAKAQEKAQGILDQINAGADFDELMNANSEDPGLQTAPDGYVFTKGEMVPEFEEAAFALAENEVSGLVNTSYGIHILKRVPFDMEGQQEVGVVDSLEYQVAIPELEKLIKTWKAKTKISKNKKVVDKIKTFDPMVIFGQ